MDQQLNRQNNEYDYPHESNLGDDTTLDATGYLFATAVLFTVLIAGVIVYRADTYDIHTASNDTPPAARSIR